MRYRDQRQHGDQYQYRHPAATAVISRRLRRFDLELPIGAVVVFLVSGGDDRATSRATRHLGAGLFQVTQFNGLLAARAENLHSRLWLTKNVNPGRRPVRRQQQILLALYLPRNLYRSLFITRPLSRPKIMGGPSGSHPPEFLPNYSYTTVSEFTSNSRQPSTLTHLP